MIETQTLTCMPALFHWDMQGNCQLLPHLAQPQRFPPRAWSCTSVTLIICDTWQQWQHAFRSASACSISKKDKAHHHLRSPPSSERLGVTRRGTEPRQTQRHWQRRRRSQCKAEEATAQELQQRHATFEEKVRDSKQSQRKKGRGTKLLHITTGSSWASWRLSGSSWNPWLCFRATPTWIPLVPSVSPHHPTSWGTQGSTQ